MSQTIDEIDAVNFNVITYQPFSKGSEPNSKVSSKEYKLKLWNSLDEC